MELNTDFIREAISGYARNNEANSEIAEAATKTLDAIEGLIRKWTDLGEKVKKMQWENTHLNDYEVYVMRYAEKSYKVKAKDGSEALEKAVDLAEHDASFEKEYHYFKTQLTPFGDDED